MVCLVCSWKLEKTPTKGVSKWLCFAPAAKILDFPGNRVHQKEEYCNYVLVLLPEPCDDLNFQVFPDTKSGFCQRPTIIQQKIGRRK